MKTAIAHDREEIYPLSHENLSLIEDCSSDDGSKGLITFLAHVFCRQVPVRPHLTNSSLPQYGQWTGTVVYNNKLLGNYRRKLGRNW